MRRYVVERGVVDSDRNRLQTCTVYPPEMNRKQVERDNYPYTFKNSLMVFNRKNNRWEYENDDKQCGNGGKIN